MTTATDTTTDHTHLTDADVEAKEETGKPWFRVYIDDPNYVNERGERVPKLLGGGSRKHCERVLKAFRKKNFAATQWQSKFVEIPKSDLGKEPKVVFDR